MSRATAETWASLEEFIAERVTRRAARAIAQSSGDWTQYRSLFDLSKDDEVDLNFSKRDNSISREDAMAELRGIVERRLTEAQQASRRYVMFIHGSSASRAGETTARSQVRAFMRSKAATPLIERQHCIQHGTVFVAKIKLAARAKAVRS